MISSGSNVIHLSTTKRHDSDRACHKHAIWSGKELGGGFGRRLRQKRLELGLSVDKLAEMAQLGRAQIVPGLSEARWRCWDRHCGDDRGGAWRVAGLVSLWPEPQLPDLARYMLVAGWL